MTRISIKTPQDIAMMAEGGKRLSKIKTELAKAAKPGITTLELDNLAKELIRQAGGKPSFAMVPGYKWATCININDVVVHGVPNNTKIRTGDKVGIDVGIYYLGFHTDTSITIGGPKRFLEIGRLALKKAIGQAKPGKRIADISEAMQTTVEDAGYSVVKALTGHGVGRSLHEDPAIPCFVVGDPNRSTKIVSGMVLAIEVMYNEGTSEVVYKNDDGWTIATADGKISGLFEETVAVTQTGPVVLT